MSGTITWHRRGDPAVPPPEGGREYLFWIEEEDDLGYASVQSHVPRHWPGCSTHWAEINAPEGQT